MPPITCRTCRASSRYVRIYIHIYIERYMYREGKGKGKGKASTSSDGKFLSTIRLALTLPSSSPLVPSFTPMPCQYLRTHLAHDQTHSAMAGTSFGAGADGPAAPALQVRTPCEPSARRVFRILSTSSYSMSRSSYLLPRAHPVFSRPFHVTHLLQHGPHHGPHVYGSPHHSPTNRPNVHLSTLDSQARYALLHLYIS